MSHADVEKHALSVDPKLLTKASKNPVQDDRISLELLKDYEELDGAPVQKLPKQQHYLIHH